MLAFEKIILGSNFVQKFGPKKRRLILIQPEI